MNALDTHHIFPLILIYGSLATGVFTFGLYMGMEHTKFMSNILNGKLVLSEATTPGCLNLSLEDTASCLKNEMQGFYKYNLSNVGKTMNFSTLEREGGVCSHYSDWYAEHIDKKKFYVTQPIIEIDKMTSHKFTIMSNAEGYCILDQMNVICGRTERT